MSIEDFVHHFEIIWVNGYRDECHLHGIEVHQPDNGFVFMTAELKKGTHTFSVHQPSDRGTKVPKSYEHQ